MFLSIIFNNNKIHLKIELYSYLLYIGKETYSIWNIIKNVYKSLIFMNFCSFNVFLNLCKSKKNLLKNCLWDELDALALPSPTDDVLLHL